MFDTLIHGLGASALVLAAVRASIGLFFVASGFHKLVNRDRHASLVKTLVADGTPDVAFMQWAIPLGEFFGGMALVAGFLTVFASFGLLMICLGAVCLDGVGRIATYKPIDRLDWVDDLLYLPETLYVLFLVLFIATGSGPFSLDALIASVL